MTFHTHSYQKHAEHFKHDLSDPERLKIHETWFDENTADYWRHNRMYEPVDAFSHDKEASWITVGDGRYGLDSIRLKKRGVKNILPTDISEALLKKSKELGYIDDYAVENAENLSFADNSFDYAMCKESFHHFPRPYLALYEMLRVARKAVVLMEPNDTRIRPFKRKIDSGRKLYLKRRIIGAIKGFLGNQIYDAGVDFDPGSYEVSGNYVYSISWREIEKLALGINLPVVAFKGINDCYIKGVEFEPADDSSEIFKKIKENIASCDQKVAAGLRMPSQILTIIFKQEPDQQTLDFLNKNDWTVHNLPRNPHL